MRRIFTSLLVAALAVISVSAANVVVKMNSVSKTMTLAEKATGTAVATGEPSGTTYTFEAKAGEYVLTGYASDGETVTGTTELAVTDEAKQEFTVFTVTAYATNKKTVLVDGEEKSVDWEEGTDYSVTTFAAGCEGETRTITLGKSTAGQTTFNVLSGDSYRVALVPSEERAAEGYLPFTQSGTVTFNVTVGKTIPMGYAYTVTTPADAELLIGQKTAHFVDFTKVEPKSVVNEGGVKRHNYVLASGQQYNFRTWREGGLTNAGIFTMNADEAKRPVLAFTDADYTTASPAFIDRDVKSNKGYNVADIFVNINERGNLKMNVGDSFDAHAMRSWEIVDGITSNYFIEPDFHYTVLDENGRPDNSVIGIEQEQGSAWATIKAKKDGTAIILVGYDAISTCMYNSNGEKKDMAGGSLWGAIWPENTAAYVVTVGGKESGITPNMTVNAGRNTADKKLAGDNVDAELDVFYYPAGTDGHAYTFKPEGVQTVTVAYPEFGSATATYKGFSAEGVKKNEDGSFTVLLKHGRQIVKLEAENGAAEYQVMTAKEVAYTLTNATNPESETFSAGDKVDIVFNTLFHPANKLAGIYNFRAAINYNKTSEGVVLGSANANQYAFASTEKAQTLSLTLPADWDGKENVKLSEGSICITYFGDPLGSHRTVSRLNGRNPNFTAVQQSTFLCSLPDIVIGNPAVHDLAVATLEDVELAEDSHMPQFTAEDEEAMGFQSGDFWFDMYVMSEYETWWGYGVANHTSTVYKEFADQFNSCTGKGAGGSKNYGIAYVSDFMGPVNVTLTTDEMMAVPGVQITNAAWSLSSMANGDGVAKKFGKGDWFKLTATGYDDEGNVTGTKDFYLADCRSEDKAEWFILNEWAFMDLSSLGAVRQIGFTLSSSDNGIYGMNTPAYFCYDNLGCEGTEETPKGNYNDVVTAISNVSPSAVAPQQRFDLQGRRLKAAQRGVNIIRTADGKVMKVVRR
ncbi:DUF4465 domain-containing protein [Prevotella sp. PINT]|uniref:DUF4465 domain-containing protein n=1 Tax=Palleniella intestinalis TaxID=2736291 RepID=UPI00155787EB|nr:DUF4465 domain-containing protein [Palleniella intestinalis]NPD81690.1 DUF4465 domain-containing protein [Palleniella intestinalis]